MEKGNGVYEGRLTGYLRECKFLPDDRKYYLCGSAEMVVQTRDLLLSEGISFGNDRGGNLFLIGWKRKLYTEKR